MDLNEYLKVITLSYYEYCDYLQKKYGIPKEDYMTSDFERNPSISRTDEGLIVHHIGEIEMIKLSDPEFASHWSFDYQKKEKLVYCDYLEHLLLHIMICENPQPIIDEYEDSIGGGLKKYIIPELTDFYLGKDIKQKWKQNCFNRVKNDKEVYLWLLTRFISKKEENYES